MNQQQDRQLSPHRLLSPRDIEHHTGFPAGLLSIEAGRPPADAIHGVVPLWRATRLDEIRSWMLSFPDEIIAHFRKPETSGLQPGDPIPPERTGGMTGFVVGECGHRVAGSEWRAGFRNCERC